MTRLAIYGIFGFCIGAIIMIIIFGQVVLPTTVLIGAVVGLILSIPLAVHLNHKNASYQGIPAPLSQLAQNEDSLIMRDANWGVYTALVLVPSLVLVATVPVLERVFLESGWGVLAYSCITGTIGISIAERRRTIRKKQIANGIRPGFW